ncbi:MAG: RecQ family ATP-dependent DNA helicase [Anaerolineales bacterium]|nr:RecQ family ATP-dependent DNA helicase [Anaerolineales bacterium]
MKETLLSQLNLTPPEVANLPNKNRTRLVNFLIRWEEYRDALACLEAMEPLTLVSLQDLKAKALAGMKRYASAVNTMKWRIQQSDSQTAQVQLATYYLYDNDLEKALTMAKTLTAEHNNALSWGLLGEVHLVRAETDAAESAFLQQQKLSPNSRSALWGLTQVHQQRGDLVTASAYAVRAFTVEDGETAVWVDLLRNLRDFFATTGDQNRLQEADEGLEIHFVSEMAQMQTLASADPVTASAPTATKKKRASQSGRTPLQRPPAPPLPDLSQIPVSAIEEEQITAAVAQHFNFPTLRPAQLQIMACALRGEDVLAILPTGAGKSLCYQLPAALDDGVTLVISPLIALMKDQVDSLPEPIQAQAIALNSTLDGSELQQAIDDIVNGRYKLVYAAPERLRQRPFIHALKEAHIARFVIDEAHCVSTWGHDFRPDYLWLRQAHQDLGAPPVLAMTATAPPLVRQDIERRLFGRSTITSDESNRYFRYIARDTFRHNLRLVAVEADDADRKMYEVLNLCQRLQGSGIVYARSRRQCEELADLLRQQGLKAEHYHARIHNRALVQERFMRGQTDIIVATIAFGMGVDKADIRFIIHFGLPNSVEAYYQEAGRAGRDGLPSYCVLIHSRSDRSTLKRLTSSDSLEVDFLRDVYAALKKKGGDGETISVNLDGLAHYLDSDDTAVRVAISTLEQAQLLQRHYDVPRAVMLQRQKGYPQVNEAFERFSRLLRLPLQHAVTRNVSDVVAATQLPLTELEAQLLMWQTMGYVEFTANGRDALLTLLPPPADSGTRINSLLDQYDTIQKQRIADIGDYARTAHCRHGYLANFLGGQPRQTCEQCNNCRGDELLPPTTAEENMLPEETEQMRWILAALDERSWGKNNLVRILLGDENIDQRGLDSIAHGALNFRTKSALGQLVVKMIRQRLIRENQLDHGGIALEVSYKGQQFLQTHGGVPLRSTRPSQPTAVPTFDRYTQQTYQPAPPPPPPPMFDDDYW